MDEILAQMKAISEYLSMCEEILERIDKRTKIMQKHAVQTREDMRMAFEKFQELDKLVPAEFKNAAKLVKENI